jgi:hypothetical protein
MLKNRKDGLKIAHLTDRPIEKKGTNLPIAAIFCRLLPAFAHVNIRPACISVLAHSLPRKSFGCAVHRGAESINA